MTKAVIYDSGIISPGFTITERERDVLEQMVRYGHTTTKEIAAALVVSERTVHSHLLNLFRKFGVRNRASLCIAYLKYLHEQFQ